MIHEEITELLNDIVYRLLEQTSMYRDNDKKLCSRIWSIQMGGVDRLKQMSAYEFLCEYSKDTTELYSQESIGRARRKIQEENPHLRGSRYREKQAQTTNVQLSLGYNV